MEKEKPFFSKDDPFFDDDTRENIKYVADALRKEKPKEEILQHSMSVGYFHTSVKEGDTVYEGQIIGFIRPTGAGEKEEEEIKAIAGGSIKKILPIQETGFTPKVKHDGKKTFISVAYGQTLFIIEQ